MHQQIDKKHRYILLIIIFLFLTTVSNLRLNKNIKNLSNINNIEVVGLSDSLNQQIKERISSAINQNIYFISENYIKESLDEYKYLESYDVFKVFPSKLMINLKQTNFLANTIKDNKKYIMGSNGKLIDDKALNLNLDLPNIFGNFSKKDFISFFNIITESKFDYNEIKDIFFFKGGRWDIKTKFGIIVKLPKNEIKSALNKAKNIIKNSEINYKIIDLRIANQVILSDE
jgi:cell division protein FtsQ|tara:strand:- start:1 stop:690 length:690 start_codon:yes stop_codon:yes gene_type:complete